MMIHLEIAHTVFDSKNSENAFLSVTQKTKTIKKFGYIFGYLYTIWVPLYKVVYTRWYIFGYIENKYNLGT